AVQKQLRVLRATRADGVIPGWARNMVVNVELREVVFADLDVQRVMFTGAGGCYPQSGLCLGASDQPQHLVETVQRFSRPIDTDGAKQAMFHRIPLRCTGGIMGHRDRQAVLVGPALQGVFPQTGTTTVAATGVGLNQQALGVGILPASPSMPPVTKGIHGKLRRVTVHPHMDVAVVLRHIVDSVGSGTELGVLREIVGVHLPGRSSPSTAVVLEVAHQLLFLGVHAENRVSPTLECFSLTSQVAKLPVSVGMRRASETLDVHSQRKTGLAQEASHGASCQSQAASQFPQAQPHKSLARGRITARLGLYDLFQALLDVGRFFSTVGRPPPGSRACSTGRPASPEANSAWPRRMVSPCRPVTRLRKVTPPWPKRFASQATIHRRCCSSHRLSNKFNWACCPRSGWSPPCVQ